MRLRPFLLITVVLFGVVNLCNAQEATGETQSLSPGERLRRVEETLNSLQARNERPNIDLMRSLQAELNGILATDSVFKSQVEADLEVVNENLAYHDLMVAAFYMTKGHHGHSFRGAASRLQNIAQRYPKFSKMDEVFFRLIVVSLRQEKKDLAIHYCWSLICNFPNSEYVNAAFDHLNDLGVSSWEGCQKFELIQRRQ
jgi:Outer membrane lipoprotein